MIYRCKNKQETDGLLHICQGYSFSWIFNAELLNIFTSNLMQPTSSCTRCEQMGCSSGDSWGQFEGPIAESPCCLCSSCCRHVPSTPGMLHKKMSASRSGSDMVKRYRIQSAYELSQDLLEKQVEMLERKYGGAKARRAALIIQRAFRRYKLLHKFAAITAMAKAEKRLSRRFQVSSDANPGSENAGSPLDWSPSHRHYQMGAENQNNGNCNQQLSHLSYHQSRFHCHKQNEMAAQQQFSCEQCGLGVDPEVVIQQHFASLYRELRENERPPRPVRSMSLRERRGASGVVEHQNIDFIQSYDFETHNTTHPHILPRSHSAGMHQQQSSNATTDSDPFDREVQSYSQFDECCMYYTATEITPCPHFSQSQFVEHSKAIHYMTKEELADEEAANNKNGSLERDVATRRSPPSVVLGNTQWTKNKVANIYMVGQVNNAGMFAASSEWGPQGNKKSTPRSSQTHHFHFIQVTFCCQLRGFITSE